MAAKYSHSNKILHRFYQERKAGKNPSIEDLPDNLQKVVRGNDKEAAEAAERKADRNAAKTDPAEINQQLKDFYQARRDGKDPSVEGLPESLQKTVIANDKAAAEAAERAANGKAAGKAAADGLNQQLHDFYQARRDGKDPSVEDLPESLQKVVRGNDELAAKAAEHKERALADFDAPEGNGAEAETELG